MTSEFSPARNALDQDKQHDAAAWTMVALISVLTYLYLSNMFTGQNLHVWGDEITYSIESRQLDFKTSTYPVYLYLALFSLAHSAGQSFLELARSMNALLIATAIPFVYATARTYTSRPWSCLIAAIAVLGPVTSYAAYFMPDAMYFAVFCMFAWFCLSALRMGPIKYGVVVGLLIALMSMIKPHALFILAGFSLMQFLLAVSKKKKIEIHLRITAASIVSFLIVRLSVGHYFGGPSGLSLIGAYSDYTSVKWSTEKIISAAFLCGTLIKGHLIGLVLVAGPALLALFLPAGIVDQNDEKQVRLRVFTASMLIVMFSTSILFSVRIADGAPIIDTMRLHTRYYNLFFPLLYITAATQLGIKKPGTPSVWILSMLLAAIAVSVISGSLKGYAPLGLDSPEVRGLSANFPVLCAAGIVIATSLIIFAYRPQFGARLYLVAALPLALLGSFYVNVDLRTRMANMPGDSAGKIAKEYLGADSSHIGFFGDVVQIYQAMFYAGDRWSFTYKLDKSEPVPNKLVPGLAVPGYLLPPGQLMPPDTKYIVVFGQRYVPPEYRMMIQAPEWALFEKGNSK